jgi:uncharacterized membrane protein
MKPSTTILSIVIVGGCMLLFGGLVYDIVNAPISSAYVNQKFYFLYPGLTGQFLFDTVIAVALYALGFVGLLAIYQSSKHAYNPRQAYMTLAVGATLVLLTYIFIEYFIRVKLSGI